MNKIKTENFAIPVAGNKINWIFVPSDMSMRHFAL
jgi:hypothetical protein